MKSFNFPLDRALRWRNLQLDAEKAKLHRILEQRARLQVQLQLCRSEKMRVTAAIGGESLLSSRDLRALGDFQRRASSEEARILKQLQQIEKDVVAQSLVYREAEQRCRVLDELRSRNLKQWQYELVGEIEQTAADAYNARYISENEKE